MVIAHGHTQCNINGVILPVKMIAFTTPAGTIDIVPAVAGKHIVLLGLWHGNGSAGSYTYLSGANTLWTNQHGNNQAIAFRSRGGRMIAETNAGEALRITVGTGTVYGMAIYAERPAA